MKPERAHLERWRQLELEYADTKFDHQRVGHDTRLKEEQLADDSWWFGQIFQYVDRARIYGLELPQGRQALAKCWLTMGGCLESMIRTFGPLPEPGHTSGEIRLWEDAP